MQPVRHKYKSEERAMEKKRKGKLKPVRWHGWW